MSDDLQRIFTAADAPQRRAAHLHLGVGPRVRGGLPLDGGPKLDLARANGRASEAPAEENARAPLPALAAMAAAVPSPASPALASKRAAPQWPLESVLATGHSAAAQGSGRTPAAQATGRTAFAFDEGHASAADDALGNQWQLEARALTKAYRKGAIEVPVLRGVDLQVEQGEFVAIVGQSGSGKSTLLHLLGTLDAPDEGEIHFRGHRIDALPNRWLDRLRNRHIGMIFQFYHLLPEMSALENVLAPLMIRHGVWGYLRHRRTYRETATQLLEAVGLGHRLKHKPRELSGGEMQRAAIARALVAKPEVLLADEPTGNLDHGTGREIIDLLRGLKEQQKLTIVMVTHDPAIAAEADRAVRLVEGRIA